MANDDWVLWENALIVGVMLAIFIGVMYYVK